MSNSGVTGIVPISQLKPLDILIHGELVDVQLALGHASDEDLRHAIRHCALNAEGNEDRRAIIQRALTRRCETRRHLERRAS